MRINYLLIWSLLTGSLLLLSSCFKVREVEPPQSTNSDWISPTNYELLLDNFELAVGQKNSQNFLRCLQSDSLFFQPSASALAMDNQSIFNNWNWVDEQTWFENAVADLGVSSGNYLRLTEENLQSTTGDSVHYIGNYELFLQVSDTNLPTKFLGQIELICKVNSFNEWEIHRWIDYETHPDSSWSLLKLNYAQ